MYSPHKLLPRVRLCIQNARKFRTTGVPMPEIGKKRTGCRKYVWKGWFIKVYGRARELYSSPGRILERCVH
jgi:hypothetical protein